MDARAGGWLRASSLAGVYACVASAARAGGEHRVPFLPRREDLAASMARRRSWGHDGRWESSPTARPNLRCDEAIAAGFTGIGALNLEVFLRRAPGALDVTTQHGRAEKEPAPLAVRRACRLLLTTSTDGISSLGIQSLRALQLADPTTNLHTFVRVRVGSASARRGFPSGRLDRRARGGPPCARSMLIRASSMTPSSSSASPGSNRLSVDDWACVDSAEDWA